MLLLHQGRADDGIPLLGRTMKKTIFLILFIFVMRPNSKQMQAFVSDPTLDASPETVSLEVDVGGRIQGDCISVLFHC